MTGITKTYQMGATPVDALRGVDLTIEKNAYAAIVGPSGSGKSTLMSIIGCLDTPSEGEYMLSGRAVGTLNSNRLAAIRNREIGFVFQSYNLLPYATTMENVELPLIYGKVPARKRRRRAQELLERVGLGHRLKHRANELSGGEMQRVAIARALANDPNILLGDEPTGNLDSASGAEIMEIFEDLWRQGHTVIVITHDPKVAGRAQQQIALQDGMIVCEAQAA